MKKSYLISRGLWAVAAIMLAGGLSGCDEREPENPSQPYLDILYDGNIDNNLTLSVEDTGGDFGIAVKSSRNWKMQETSASWVSVNPAKGNKDKTTPVNIHVDPNPDPARSVTLVFATTDGANTRKVVINQAGNGEPPVGSQIYFEDAGSSVSKDDSGYWPYVTDFTGWTKKGTVNQSAVTYTGNASVRNSGPQWDPVKGSAASSTAPYVYLSGSSAQTFGINQISTGGKTNFTFAWIMQDTKSSATGDSGSFEPTTTPISTSTVKLQIGFNGTDFADVAYTVGDIIGNGWTNVKAEFKVPDGTTTLYMIFSGYGNGEGLRSDSFSLTEGGNGTIINPGGGPGPGPDPEGTELTLTQVRALYTGSDYTFPADKQYVKGTVIVDFDQNNVASLKNLMISDGTAGITARLAADAKPGTDNALPQDAEVYINLAGLTITSYQGLVQLTKSGTPAGVPNADVVLTGQTKPITPKEITATQFNSGDYQSMLVKISNVQFTAAALGKKFNDDSFKITTTGTGAATSATAIPMESNTGDNYPVYMSYYSQFKETDVPSGSGYIIGVGTIAGDPTVNQLMPRTTADMSGLTGTRFGGGKYFNVNPSEGPVAVLAEGGEETVSVTANVAWTATVLSGSDNLSAQPSPDFGSGNATIKFTFKENTSSEAKTMTLRVTTNDTGVTTKTYDILFNQYPAGGGETLVSDVAKLTAGTYYIAGLKTVGSTTYELWTGGLSNTAGGYLLTNSYTYSSGVLIPVTSSEDGAKVIELVSTGTANTYYIKYGNQYLYNTTANSSNKLALTDTPTAWTFANRANSNGIAPLSNGVTLMTATNASSNYIRAYASATQYDIGVYFFKATAPAPAFNVTTASPVTVTAAGGAQTVNVTGNVAWTTEVLASATATYTGLTPSGTGAGDIAISIDANTEQTAKSLTLRVSTTAAVTPQHYDIVFNQDAAAVVKTFGVSTATPVTVAAVGGEYKVNVTGNVAWTAVVEGGNTATLSTDPTPDSGTGADEISLMFNANSDTANDKTLTLTVSTTDAGVTGQKSYSIVFNQDKAAVVKTFGVSTASPVTVDAAGGSQTINVTGNVEWTAAVEGVATASHTPLVPSVTSGPGTVTFTIDPNTDQTAKTMTVRVSTTDADITTKYYDIVYNQAAATPVQMPIGRIANLTPGTYYMAGFSDGNYQLWTGAVSNAAGGDCKTSSYGYGTGQLVFVSGTATPGALIQIESASAANTYYIKTSDGKYLYSSADPAANRKLALTDTATPWVFTDSDKGGIYGSSGGVYIGTASASSDYIRSYTGTTSYTAGLFFFDAASMSPITDYLEANAAPVTVVAGGGAQSVAVSASAGVTWTTSVSGTAAYSDFSPASETGTGNGTISFTIGKNNDQVEKTLTLTISTTATVPVNSYTIVFTQDAAAAAGESIETFSNFTSTNNSYTAAASNGTYTSTEVTGLVWTYAGTAHNQGTGTGKAKFFIGRYNGSNANPGSLTTSTISTGVGSISIDWCIGFGDTSTGVSFKVFVNDVEKGTFTQPNATSTAGTFGTYTIDNINVSGNAVIKIASNEAGRPGVNQVSWTAY